MAPPNYGMEYRVALLVAMLFALIVWAFDVEARDAKQVRAYRAENPCPATGKTRGACPGYVVDHIVPLCAGGADAPDNMIWQSKAEALEKDRTEWALCRWIHRLQERKAAE
jgi:hypothetical protein